MKSHSLSLSSVPLAGGTAAVRATPGDSAGITKKTAPKWSGFSFCGKKAIKSLSLG